MTEPKDGIEGSRLVSTVRVDELLGLLMYALDLNANGKGPTIPVGADPLVAKLTVSQFTALMLDQMKTRAFSTANVESSVAERILEDWKGLEAVHAVTQPFRIRTVKDVDAFADNLRKACGTGKGELVVAVAITTGNRTYQKAEGL